METKEKCVNKEVLTSAETSGDKLNAEIVNAISSDNENWISEEYSNGFEDLQESPDKMILFSINYNSYIRT